MLNKKEIELIKAFDFYDSGEKTLWFHKSEKLHIMIVNKNDRDKIYLIENNKGIFKCRKSHLYDDLMKCRTLRDYYLRHSKNEVIEKLARLED